MKTHQSTANSAVVQQFHTRRMKIIKHETLLKEISVVHLKDFPLGEFYIPVQTI